MLVLLNSNGGNGFYWHGFHEAIKSPTLEQVVGHSSMGAHAKVIFFLFWGQELAHWPSKKYQTSVF